MLRYSEDKIEDERAISALYANVQKELTARKKLYEIFRRKLTDEELASLSDEDIKVPLERYVAVMATGYYGGKAPVYKVKAFNEEREKIITKLFNQETNDEQEIKEIEELIKHIVDYNNDASHFLHLVLDFLVKRACYEIYYKDEKTGEITIARSDALETVAIWDYSLPKKLIGIYRLIQTTMANGEYQQMVELTTANGKRYYMDTPEKRKLFGTPEYDVKFTDKEGKIEPLFKENEKMKQPKLWDDDIPAMAIEQEDGLAVFEPVISLVKAYQTCIQNSRNTFKYNDEAKLAVKGYMTDNGMGTEERESSDEVVLKSKVVYLDGDRNVDSNIWWVEKNVNDTAVQNHKKTLMDLICLCSFCPNMTDLGFTQADNNSALEKKFFSLQQYIATFEGDFVEGLKRRWRIILNKINKEKGTSYDFRDVEIRLQRNLPSDRTTDIANGLKLRGLLPDETIINMLNLDLDAQSELAKMEEQSMNAIEQNLQQMQMMEKSGVEIEETEKDKEEDKVTDLTETQKASKLTADTKKEQEKTINKQIKKE